MEQQCTFLWQSGQNVAKSCMTDRWVGGSSDRAEVQTIPADRNSNVISSQSMCCGADTKEKKSITSLIFQGRNCTTAFFEPPWILEKQSKCKQWCQWCQHTFTHGKLVCSVSCIYRLSTDCIIDLPVAMTYIWQNIIAMQHIWSHARCCKALKWCSAAWDCHWQTVTDWFIYI